MLVLAEILYSNHNVAKSKTRLHGIYFFKISTGIFTIFLEEYISHVGEGAVV